MCTEEHISACCLSCATFMYNALHAELCHFCISTSSNFAAWRLPTLALSQLQAAFKNGNRCTAGSVGQRRVLCSAETACS